MTDHSFLLTRILLILIDLPRILTVNNHSLIIIMILPPHLIHLLQLVKLLLNEHEVAVDQPLVSFNSLFPSLRRVDPNIPILIQLFF